MEYREYPGEKTPLVCRYRGSGFMEDPHTFVEVAGSFEDRDEAIQFKNTLTYTTNTQEEIESTFLTNTYVVNINTLTLQGKKVEKDFETSFEEKWGSVKDCFKVGEFEIKFCEEFRGFWNDLSRNEILDEPKLPIESCSFTFLDFSDGKDNS